MRKLLENMKKKQEGFTLIELIIVIAILAIIAAIAVPNILGAIENSRKASDVSNAKVIYNTAAQVLAKNSDYNPTDAADVNVTGLATAALTADTFEADLFNDLNQTELAPAFDSATRASFFIRVDANNRMSVVVNDGTNDIELAPEADDEYDQD